MTTPRALLRRAAATLAGLGLATAASAHPGHGDHDSLGLLATLIHPLEMHHLLWALLVAAVVGRAMVTEARSARSPLALGLLATAALAAGGLALLGRA